MLKTLLPCLVLVCNALFSSIWGPEIEEARDLSGVPPASTATFWDAYSELNQDYIVIGAGIVGMSTAIEIKEHEPKAKVLVLERGTLPIGASSRNAGFACIGSYTEFFKDTQELGQDGAIHQMQERWNGLKTLREKLGDEAIGFSMTGNYELVAPQLEPFLKHLDDVNALLLPLFGENVYVRCDEKVEEFGFSKDHVSAIVLNKFEGEINSGMLMHALFKKAQDLGITIRYGSCAERPVASPDGLKIDVTVQGRTTTFTAKGVAICINAFTSDLVPEINITPGRAQILVTEPLSEPVKFDAPVHMGQGYWFFRPLPGNRILLGGGRCLNFDGETTTQLEITPDIMGPLKQILTTIILPGQNPKIERVWSGIMGFSEDRLPRIEELPDLPNVVVGFGCNGVGVARGYRIGQKTAALLINHH